MHGLDPLEDDAADTVFRDVVMLALAGFDAEATHFHLSVQPAEKLQIPIRAISHPIARSI